MKKSLLTGLVFIMANISISANAIDLSGVSNLLKSSASIQNTQNTQDKTTVNQFETWENQINQTNLNTQNIFMNIVSMLSSEQETNTIKSEIDTIMNNTNSTQAQKSSLVSQLISSYASSLMNNKTSIISKIQNMSASEKSNLSNTIGLLSENATQYLTLAKNYTSVASTPNKLSSNILVATSKLQKTSTTITTLKNNASALTNLASSISSLMKQAK